MGQPRALFRVQRPVKPNRGKPGQDFEWLEVLAGESSWGYKPPRQKTSLVFFRMIEHFLRHSAPMARMRVQSLLRQAS